MEKLSQKKTIDLLDSREFLGKYPKVFGRFYHGSPLNVEKLLPSSHTDNIRPGEEGRRGFKDVIFFSTNIDEAIRYAGEGGTVFCVDATAIQYKPVAVDILDEKKVKSVGEDIFVAFPEDIKIVSKWHKEKGRKRGDPEKYDVEYIGEQEKSA